MPPVLHPEIDRAGEATPHTITQMHAFFCPLTLTHTHPTGCLCGSNALCGCPDLSRSSGLTGHSTLQRTESSVGCDPIASWLTTKPI